MFSWDTKTRLSGLLASEPFLFGRLRGVEGGECSLHERSTTMR